MMGMGVEGLECRFRQEQHPFTFQQVFEVGFEVECVVAVVKHHQNGERMAAVKGCQQNSRTSTGRSLEAQDFTG